MKGINRILLLTGMFFLLVILGELFFLYSSKYSQDAIIKNVTNLTKQEANKAIQAGILVVKPNYYYKITEYEGLVASIEKNVKHKGTAGKTDWLSTDILMEKNDSKWELREKDVMRTAVVRDEGKRGRLEKSSLDEVKKGDKINIKIATEPFGDGKYKIFFVLITKLN